MLAQVHLLIIVVLAARELGEAIHVASDSQAVIGRRSFASLVPFVLQDEVHAFGLFIAGVTVVKDGRRERILDCFVAERVLIVQPNVPAGLDTVIIAVHRLHQDTAKRHQASHSSRLGRHVHFTRFNFYE